MVWSLANWVKNLIEKNDSLSDSDMVTGGLTLRRSRHWRKLPNRSHHGGNLWVGCTTGGIIWGCDLEDSSCGEKITPEESSGVRPGGFLQWCDPEDSSTARINQSSSSLHDSELTKIKIPVSSGSPELALGVICLRSSFLIILLRGDHSAQNNLRLATPTNKFM